MSFFLKIFVNILLISTLSNATTFGVPITINVPADYLTIQEAIDNASNGDTIIVAEGEYFENIDFKGKSITITSEYFNLNDITVISNTIINGGGLGSVVNFNTTEDANAKLEGFTIKNGYATDGGGIFIGNSSSPTLKNLIITGNIADQFGGGVFIDVGANPIITKSLITYNSAVGSNGNGGGVGMTALLNTPYFEQVTIAENVATESGAGFYMNTSGGDQGTVNSTTTLNSCIIWNQKLTGFRKVYEELSIKQDGSTPNGDTFFNVT